MDEMNIKPNIAFNFTAVNSKTFNKTNIDDVINADVYSIPDYWFSDEQLLLEFSKTLKNNEYFIDYFHDMLQFSIEDCQSSCLFLTLRTNYALIFVSVDNTGYYDAIEKIIELNIVLERYEKCGELTKLKQQLLDNFSPIADNSTYEIGIIFWGEYYSKFEHM